MGARAVALLKVVRLCICTYWGDGDDGDDGDDGGDGDDCGGGMGP